MTTSGKIPLTQARLQELLHYDPETGVFTRLVATSNRVKVGDVAGFTDANGYTIIRVESRPYKAHRLAWLYMNGTWPTHDIDHIDTTRSNNTAVNLREATRSENNGNRSLNSNNKTGIKGVTFIPRYNKYAARIRVKGRGKHLGYFTTKEEAAAAYATAAKEYFGEFARTS